MTQVADGQTGHYYVTARDRGKTAVLLGPFTQVKPGTMAHRQALGAVTMCRRYVSQRYADVAFATYGTCRIPLDSAKVPTGRLGRTRIA